MKSKETARVITLGGVSEIGKNMSAVEYGGRILVIDSGLMFPDADMLGVDIVIPDISYLVERADRIDGIVLTHGHEDHIGALPYVLRQIQAPLWGTSLTLGFVRAKLEEFGLADAVEMHQVCATDRFQVGSFDVETFRVSHSIPDSFGLAVRLPIGMIMYTGDFKFDQSPIDGNVTDFAKLAQLGAEGVSLLLIDCTNVEKPGNVPSERVVGDVFEDLFSHATGKIIVASFASNIHRIQQVINTAALFGRKVAVAGRSMAQNIDIAIELGYLAVPDGTMVGLDEIADLHAVEVVVMTTGSQGEPLSALTRIAMDEHRKVKIEKGDTVIISATPIPGNEDLVMRTVNRLFKRGANVVYDAIARVHVSGHANREELKLMLNLTKPTYLVPVHGEQRHIARFAELAAEMAIPGERVFTMEPGDVVELDIDGARMADKVESGAVLVDGAGVGDVEDTVIRDRRHLAHDGVFVVVLGLDKATARLILGPEVSSRGFIQMEEAEGLIEEVKERITGALAGWASEPEVDWEAIRASVRSSVAKLLNTRTGRRPMVIPVIMEM